MSPTVKFQIAFSLENKVLADLSLYLFTVEQNFSAQNWILCYDGRGFFGNKYFGCKQMSVCLIKQAPIFPPH